MPRVNKSLNLCGASEAKRHIGINHFVRRQSVCLSVWHAFLLKAPHAFRGALVIIETKKFQAQKKMDINIERYHYINNNMYVERYKS